MPADTDLVAYLAAVGPPGVTETAGTDLVEGPMPAMPNNCVAITLYDHEDGREFRVMAPNLTRPGAVVALVQLMVRNELKATAATRAYILHALLDGMVNQVLSGRLYHMVESIDGEPSCLGQDQNERWRYVSNYRVVKASG